MKEYVIEHPILCLVIPAMLLLLIPIGLDIFKQYRQYDREYKDHPNLYDSVGSNSKNI
jgi:hypothetical protein